MDVTLTRRRRLRRQSTDAEAVLWDHLRNRHFSDFKFRRQQPLGPFIADFFCPARSLAIELVRGQQFEPNAQAYAAWRIRFLNERGIAVLRFQSDQIFREIDAVLKAILHALSDPDPSR
jgi:very-short-patch-repair endonuclease